VNPPAARARARQAVLGTQAVRDGAPNDTPFLLYVINVRSRRSAHCRLIGNPIA
jgi:hypothetical protein